MGLQTAWSRAARLGLLWAALAAVSAMGIISVDVPLDNWIYEGIERLTVAGLIDNQLLNTRPISRYDAARGVAQAIDRMRDEPLRAGDRWWIKRLAIELAPEVSYFTTNPFAPGQEAVASYIAPADRLRLEGTSSCLEGENAVWENDYGERRKDGFQVRGQWRANGTFWDFLAFDSEISQATCRSGPDTHALYGKLAFLNTEILVGKQNLWWGPGRHGALHLSNNSRPFKMIKLGSPRATLLPWIFHYLGPFKYQVFCSLLDDDPFREYDRPVFTGMRLNFKPRPWFELGMSRVIILGGEGQPTVHFDDLWEIIKGKNIKGEADTSNQIAGLDVTFVIPCLRTRLYAEAAGEDEASGLPSLPGYVAGIYVPGIIPWKGRDLIDLRFEFAKTHRIWYLHPVYGDYAFYGRIMGHHIGGDARGLYGELVFHPTFNDELRIHGERITANRSKEPRCVRRIGGRFRHRFDRRWSTYCFYRHECLEGNGHNNLAGLGLELDL